MTRMLHLQCDYGVSGDMVVGALLDLGASEKGLRAALETLDLEGYEVKITRKLAGALDACDFDVVMDAAHENHDHDMDWLYGGLEDAPEGMAHVHEHEHAHKHHHDGHQHGDQHHDHHGHHHDHVHRHLADVRGIIEGSGLSKDVRQRALRVFEILAEAEAKAHGSSVEEVHFHEVGAVDSIVDIVSAAWCLDDLGVERVVVSALAEGEGHVRCAHGVLSVPVPAVANIVEAHGLVLRRAHRHGELVTPTGAALVAAIVTDDDLPECYRIVSTGMGTGKRAYDPPSVVRAQLLEEVDESPDVAVPEIWRLVTEVDDCTGEALGYVLDHLLSAGAREAHFIPVFMKKGRPAYQIEVICDEEYIQVLEQVLFEDTTTIGIRRSPQWRTVLPREEATLQTEFGSIRAKRVTLPDGQVRVYPEYEAVAEVAQKNAMGYMDVLRRI